MTRRRNDSHSTEFGLWLRDEPRIGSDRGFVATNLDFIWENYRSGHWMIIEEKRFGSNLTWSQAKQFRRTDLALRWAKTFYPVKGHHVKKYTGFHLLVFEKTSPEDGKIWLDRESISREQLVEFLEFRAPREMYDSFFKKNPSAAIFK